MGRRRRCEEREARSMKHEPNFDLITGNADKIRNCYQRQIHEEARGVENDDTVVKQDCLLFLYTVIRAHICWLAGVRPWANSNVRLA